MQVVVDYERKPHYFHLSRSLKKLGSGNRQSIAKAAVGNTTLLLELVSAICGAVGAEMKYVCSESHDSILQLKSKTALEHFTWETVWTELQQSSPTLMAILHGFTPVTKHNNEDIRPALCLCASILLMLQNDKVNLVQSVISLVLKAGHATKQVCICTCTYECVSINFHHTSYYSNSTFIHVGVYEQHKLRICLMHTVSMMDTIAHGHDEEVLEWQDALMKYVPPPNPTVRLSYTNVSHIQ